MNEDKATRYHRLRRRAFLLAAAWRVFLLRPRRPASRRPFSGRVGPRPLASCLFQFPLTVLAGSWRWR
jgi:hypothetical protein